MPLLRPTRGILLNKSHPLARGLVGCWLFNEGTGLKVADSSGNRNTGSIITADFVPGRFGHGLDFDGSNDYVNLGKPKVLAELPASDFTIILWAERDAACNDLISNGIVSSGCYLLQVYPTVVKLDFWTSGSSGAVSGSTPIAVNTWHQIGMRSISGVQVDAILDGEIDGTDSDVGTAAVRDNNVYIGSRTSGASSDRWDGTIDHVMIWNRALSEPELQQLYREPFCMFEGAIRRVLIGSPIVDLAGASVALSSLSATAKTIRKVGGNVAGTSNVAALLNLIRGEEGSQEIERSWLREALFNGMTANAFKLGTTLSLGWFWVRIAGCSVLYRGPSMERIDFTNILTVAEQNACEISPPSYIPHNNNSTYFYVIRRFNKCGFQELSLSAAVKVSIDASGELEKPQPNRIFNAKAEQVEGNKILLIWFYCPLAQKSQPVCFNVYYDGGLGQIDYEYPLAKINYEGRRFYSCQSGALGAGEYLFTIRAEDADGVENSSSAQLKIQLDTTNPDAIDILSTETV